MIGVWNSVKPEAHIRSRKLRTTAERSIILRCSPSRRRSRKRGHTGLLNTYTTLLLHLPGDDVTIAMLVNRTNVDLLSMIRQRPAGGGPSLLSLAIHS